MVNLDIAAVERPEEVEWVDPAHPPRSDAMSVRVISYSRVMLGAIGLTEPGTAMVRWSEAQTAA